MIVFRSEAQFCLVYDNINLTNMAVNPSAVTKGHVLSAIEKIKQQGIKLTPSTKFSVEIEGELYPPKEIMRYAHSEFNGEHFSPSGGEATNKYFRRMGFRILGGHSKEVDPASELVNRYKQHIAKHGLEDEIYKWFLISKYGGRPNLETNKLLDELSSINFSNLIYGVGIGAIHHLARDAQEEYRACLKDLFDESAPITDRVQRFSVDTLTVYRTLVPEKHLSHHQDERTIATLLTYKYPGKYAFYKDSFYRKFCGILGEKPKKKGHKYVHYLELLRSFVSDYVLTDDVLLNQIDHGTQEAHFKDANRLLLGQDILYQTLDKQVGLKSQYWRLGTTEGGESRWEEMIEESVASIGWSDLGDLNDWNLSGRKDLLDRLHRDHYVDDKRTASRKSGEIFDFFNNISVGDKILAQDGQDVLGVGIVEDDYQFNPNNKFAHQRRVKWYDVSKLNLKNPQGLRTTIYRLTDMVLINEIKSILEDGAPQSPAKSTCIKEFNRDNMNLNEILFGPPGTGKTFNTINKSLEILGFDLNGQSRERVKEAFDNQLNKGSIVFTTFHQSMTYEDFVEGIKPQEPDEPNQPIPYKVEDGIFKKCCARAAYNCYKVFIQQTAKTQSYSFDDLYDAYIAHTQRLLDENKPPVYKTLRNHDVEIKRINRNNSILARAKDSVSDTSAPLTKENLQKLYDEFSSVEEIRTLSQVKDTVRVGPRLTEFYAVFNGIKQFEKTFKPDDVFTEMKEFDELSEEEIEKKFNDGVFNTSVVKHAEIADPVVLIIDEINRGNVSQILGELITLIEENKRLGRSEVLKVTLSYSKSRFSIPSNLYILGTMNTADRSVEALDTALRRRFKFSELEPNPNLIGEVGKSGEQNGIVDGINLIRLLETINNRIERLLDRDHLIGHSYFLTVDSLKALQDVFSKNVIPLLQEYFYGDVGKIGLVIGRGFFEIHSDQKTPFAKFDDYDESPYEDQIIFRLKDVSDMKDSDFEEALKGLFSD